MKLDTKELKTISILYVEDDDTIRIQTLSLFTKIFKKVYSAQNGKIGLEVYKENKNDIEIIITDINMPILNGLEMVKEINDLNVSVPIIVTTAYTDSDNLINAIDLDIDKYIAKPIQIRELTVSIVNLVLKYRRSNNIESLAKDLVVKNSKNSKNAKILKSELEIKSSLVKYYETILDNFVFKVITDKHGNIKNTSTKFLQFFDCNKDELKTKNINDFKCDKCKEDSFQKLMLKAIHTKKTISSTHTLLKDETSRLNFDVTTTANYGEDSLVSGYTFYLDLIAD